LAVLMNGHFLSPWETSVVDHDTVGSAMIDWVLLIPFKKFWFWLPLRKMKAAREYCSQISNKKTNCLINTTTILLKGDISVETGELNFRWQDQIKRSETHNLWQNTAGKEDSLKIRQGKVHNS
jgi:hypothetical protein